MSLRDLKVISLALALSKMSTGQPYTYMEVIAIYKEVILLDYCWIYISFVSVRVWVTAEIRDIRYF